MTISPDADGHDLLDTGLAVAEVDQLSYPRT